MAHTKTQHKCSGYQLYCAVHSHTHAHLNDRASRLFCDDAAIATNQTPFSSKLNNISVPAGLTCRVQRGARRLVIVNERTLSRRSSSSSCRPRQPTRSKGGRANYLAYKRNFGKHDHHNAQECVIFFHQSPRC